MDFHYHLLRSKQNHAGELRGLIAGGDFLGNPLWGAFTALFGLASNEMIVVSYAHQPTSSVHELVVKHEAWHATARPNDDTVCKRNGLYVFRRFKIRAADVDELVSLSQTAWQTFEHTTEYQAEPMGLFRLPTDGQGLVDMQLVTWYDNFDSWSLSRNPHADAMDNFKRRQKLTLSSYAIATQLVDV